MRYFSSIDRPSRNLVGNKFYQLAVINKYFSVPEAFCLNNTGFTASLPPAAKEAISSRLILLKSNGGYGLSRIQKEIDVSLRTITLPHDLINEIRIVSQKLSPRWSKKLIVRSSSCFEDSDGSSGAGIYLSVPEIRNFRKLCAAIVKCWQASFSLQALAHRLRIKEFSIDPMPGVIVQVQVRGDLSGVVFSCDPLSQTDAVMVEYTSNSTSGIQAGTGEAKSFYAFKKSLKSYVNNNRDIDPALANKLIDTSLKLKQIFRKDVEYEWATDSGKLYLLQSRPITALTKSDRQSTAAPPVFSMFDLYADWPLVKQLDLGQIKGLCEYSISKRKAIRDFLVRNSCITNGTAVLYYNKQGLENQDLTHIPPLETVNTPIFTIDLGPHLRAFYSTRSQLKSTLKTLTAHNLNTVAVMVREFASGEYSAVSVEKNGRILIEVCRGSLIGINRGFVETVSYLVDIDKQTVSKLSSQTKSHKYYDFDRKLQGFRLFTDAKSRSEFKVSPNALLEIARYNRLVNQKFGHNLLEWTLVSGKPVYIDNTPDNSQVSWSEGKDISFLSPGRISGKSLVISDLKKLEYISSGPTLNVSGNLPTLESNQEIKDLVNQATAAKNIVIVSKFPYTALSVLVEKVQGFIFESGPVLCHLAIICRETKTPIAIVPRALKKYKTGRKVEIHV